MVNKGIRPDNFTYPSVLRACGEKLDVDFGRKVHNSISCSCHDQNLYVHNALISMYGKFGKIYIACDLFNKMLDRDDLSWNIMIRSGGLLRTGYFKGSLELLSQMRSSGIHLDPVAIIIGLGAYSHVGTLKLGKEIHGSAIRSCSYVFENVRNAMITIIQPLCARVANLQHGKEFHCYITRRKVFEDRLLLWNALVDMYARSGSVLAAKRVFDLMRKRDEVTYTLITEYGMQGEGQAAIKLFEEMINFQIKPDHVTMVAVLSACSHCGLVIEGQVWFEKMQSFYHIIPCLVHFSCMVDLYGHAGFFNKAKETITN
ncbi:hypothetical protein CRYUN_Cryun38cG0023800 [Craigia yunnanensis]